MEKTGKEEVVKRKVDNYKKKEVSNFDRHKKYK
jgi:hypothetical protein